MILPKLVRTDAVLVSNVEILDGYGKMFDPVKHAMYVRAAHGDDTFAPSSGTSEPLYVTPKDKPAGYYDKSDKGNY